MKISRRKFVAALSSILVTFGSVDAFARTRGAPIGAFPQGIDTRNVLNVQADSSSFLNFAKGWAPTTLLASNADANGYPINAVSASNGIVLKQNFYSKYAWRFDGTASMQFIGQPAIVFNGGLSCGLGTNTGIVTSNFSILNAANPRVEFKFGSLVTAITVPGGGADVIISTASLRFGLGVSTGTKVTLAQGCSSNLVNGPNADGSWTATNISGTQFSLNGSGALVSPTITTGGVVGVNSEAVFGIGNPDLSWINVGTFASPSNLIVCTLANLNDIIVNGLIWDADFVTDIRSLMGTSTSKSPGWLRWMDLNGVQNNWDQDFNQRMLTSQQCWTNNQLPRPGYYVSAGLTNTGAGTVGAFTFSDIFTCAPPSASPVSGPPVDGEMVQGAVLSVATGATPGLAMTGRTGTWPIVDVTASWFVNPISGAAGSGVNCDLTVSASWLNGGSPYLFRYTTVSGDTNRDTFGLNFATAFAADPVLSAAKFVSSYGANPFYVLQIICPTALADATNGMVRITYSGPAALSVGTLPYSGNSGNATGNRLSTNLNTLMFSKLLGAFIRIGNFPAYCPPFEAFVELSNRTGNNLWFTLPIYTQQAFVTGLTAYMAQPQVSGGLASNLKLGIEVGNEMWNFFLQPWSRAQCYGVALGLFTGAYGNNAGPYSWVGRQTINYSSASKAAWAAAGRPAANHYTMMMSQVDDITIGGNWEKTTLKGQYLTTSIASWANFGGVGFVSIATSYNVSGSWPADIAEAIGIAPYWASSWLGGTASSNPAPINGTVAQNAALLQASFDYVSGSTATAFTSLTDQFSGSTTKSGGSTGAYNLGVAYLSRFITTEATAGQFDSARVGRGQARMAVIHYEGGPQWQPGANFNNGVNSINCLSANIPGADVTALVSRMTALGWTTGQLIPYTISGTGDLTEVATNILVTGQGWKYDTDVTANPAGTNSYRNFITTYYYQALQNISGINREARAAQYGVWGSAWGFYSSSWQQGAAAAYKNRDAFANWNA